MSRIMKALSAAAAAIPILFSCVQQETEIPAPGEEFEDGSGVCVTVNVIAENTATRSSVSDTVLTAGVPIQADTCTLLVTDEPWPVGEAATRGIPVTSVSDMSTGDIRCGVELRKDGSWFTAYVNRTLTKVSGQPRYVSSDKYVLAGPQRVRFMMLWPADGITLGASMSVPWSPSQTVSSQKDLLWSSTEMDVPSGELLESFDATFHHALTQVKVKTNANSPAITVSSVSFRDVYSSGTLDARTGDFALDLQARATYTISGATMTANTVNDITAGGKTFLLLPQTCPEGAVLHVGFSFRGEDYSMDVPVSGHSWAKGRIVTYTLGFDGVRYDIGFDRDLYTAAPRKSVVSTVNYTSEGEPVYGKGAVPGADGLKWSVTPPAGLPHTDIQDTDMLDYSYDPATDRITWTPTRYAAPGAYTISCQTLDGRHSDEAVLQVEDTRWINTHKAGGADKPRTQSITTTKFGVGRSFDFYYAFGDKSVSDSDDHTKSGPNMSYFMGRIIPQADFHDHIGVRMVADAGNYFTINKNEVQETMSDGRYYNHLALKCTVKPGPGQYKAEVYWIDSWDEETFTYLIRDEVIIDVTADSYYALEITPAESTIYMNQTQQLTVKYYHVVNGTRTLVGDVTNSPSLTWYCTVTDPAAELSSTGLVTPLHVGTFHVSCKYEGVTSRDAVINIVDVPAGTTYGYELVLDGPAVTVKVGGNADVVRTARFYTITYVNGVETGRTYETVTATLVTDNAAIATVNNTTAKVSGVAEGSTTLHGTYVHSSTTYTSTNRIAVTVRPDSGWGVDDDDDSGEGDGEGGEYKHDN